ncbi:MAG: DUF3549 family protein [Gammaproteobacteria bacterium]|nr:DUF3549 family protein [Gammaproteobacteria bacterium]
MADISGISDFLNQAGTQYRIFDMGRRIQPIEADSFLAFEQSKIPYPYPLQQQAWLGIVVWNNDQQQDLVIWFLRFPLDAKGCLTPGIRDDFLYRLLKKDDSDDGDETNPYGFKPKQEHMAVFHAKVARLLQQAPSQFYEHARDYFAGTPGYEQWAFVGFQGIADVACRLDEEDNTELLQQAIPQLPEQPFDALCQCLEHENLPHGLSQALANRLQTVLKHSPIDNNQVSLCLRALSSAEDAQLSQRQITQVLTSAASTNPEVLASISGRCWLALQQPELMMAFLEQLAQCSESQEFFNLVIVDLINIPGMQEHLNQAIRNSHRSEQLSTAIGRLFQDFTQ